MPQHEQAGLSLSMFPENQSMHIKYFSNKNFKTALFVWIVSYVFKIYGPIR